LWLQDHLEAVNLQRFPCKVKALISLMPMTGPLNSMTVLSKHTSRYPQPREIGSLKILLTSALIPEVALLLRQH
jgi:hypothetical protein